MRKTLLNPQGDRLVIHSRGRLPHWEVPEGLYFITFRQADSIPPEVTARLRLEHERLLTTLKQRDQWTAVERAQLSERVFLQLDAALDRGYGSCILRQSAAARIVRDAILFLDDRNYDLLAWSVMPNHVHLVVRLRPGWTAWQTMKSLKGFTAREINRLLGSVGRFWQREYFDSLVRDERELAAVVDYVRHNPAKAGLKSWPWVG